MEVLIPDKHNNKVARRMTMASKIRPNREYARNEALRAIKNAADRIGQSCFRPRSNGSMESSPNSASGGYSFKTIASDAFVAVKSIADAAVKSAAAVNSANSYEEAIKATTSAAQHAASANQQLAEIMNIASVVSKYAATATKAANEAQEYVANFLNE